MFSFLLILATLHLYECVVNEVTDNRFQDECLEAHNYYRRHHGSKDLTVGRDAVEYARKRVKNLAKIEGTSPSYSGYGENLFWYYHSRGHQNCTQAVSVWYDGIKSYDFNRPAFSDKSGGFTQVVWRGTKQLGCALAKSDTRRPQYGESYETYIVCNYYPPGNVDGQFPYNVLPVQRPEPEPDYPRPTKRPTRPPEDPDDYTRPSKRPTRPPEDDYPSPKPTKKPTRPTEDPDDYPTRPTRRPTRPDDYDEYPSSTRSTRRPTKPDDYDEYPSSRPTKRPNRPIDDPDEHTRPTRRPRPDYVNDYPANKPPKRPFSPGISPYGNFPPVLIVRHPPIAVNG